MAESPCGARADDGVQLVDERDDLPVALLDLGEDGLQALLELAAVLGARDHRAEVERDQPLVPQGLGDVALDDALGEPFDDGRLADAGLTDEHGVVLGTAGQDLDDPPDLLVTPDDGVELAFPGGCREVRTELLQRLVLALRVGSGHPAPSLLFSNASSSLFALAPCPERISPARPPTAAMPISRCSVEM